MIRHGLVVAACAAVLSAGGDFAPAKARVLKNLDTHIEILQSGRNCVASAANEQQLAQCKAQTETAMKKFEMAKLEAKKEAIEAAQKRLGGGQ